MGDISDVTRQLAEEAYKMTLEHLEKLDRKDEIQKNLIDHRNKRIAQLEEEQHELYVQIAALEELTHSTATVVSPPQDTRDVGARTERGFMAPDPPWCRWCWPAAGLYYNHRITHACVARATCPCTGPHMPS